MQLVLRSGAYLAHDRDRTPFRHTPDEGTLSAALELWAQVTSTPEPGLAIAGLGSRDVSGAECLPVPLRVRRRDGTTGATTGLRLTRLNDHHAFIEVSDGAVLFPGDLICFGILHPRAALDRWRVIRVVEADDTVSDLLATYF